VILVDANLLIYAAHESADHHATAKAWWETALSEEENIGLPWVTILGFLRVATNPRAYSHPMPVKRALDFVREWLDHPLVSIAEPGPRHFEILQDLLLHVGIGGNLTTDAHLAALAIETYSELYSFDHDFARFPGLRWRNPAHLRSRRHS
jgi:toxin-antitoxin system PIN domain toxin